MSIAGTGIEQFQRILQPLDRMQLGVSHVALPLYATKPVLSSFWMMKLDGLQTYHGLSC